MQCKFRQFLALIVSVGVTSLILCIFNREEAAVNLEQLVSETHKQLETLKANLQNGDKRLEVEDKYVDMLGFSDANLETPPKGNDFVASHNQRGGLTGSGFSPYNDTSLPITVVSSVQKGQLLLAEGFVANIQQFLPTSGVILWNVDPSTPIDEDNDFSVSLKQICNSTNCIVKRFNFEDYPDHIRDLRAYRPIILQTLLEEQSGNCLLYLDIDRQLMRSSRMNLQRLLNLSQNGGSGGWGSDGIIGWSAGHPTSSLTHPKMLQFFQSDVENYYFHRMIDASQLLLCKTANVKSKVMRPWLACTLKKECIAPFGAQSTGCRFDKKPLYRYSGCHTYENAALNVALGLAFPLHQPYIARSAISRPSQWYTYNLTTTS